MTAGIWMLKTYKRFRRTVLIIAIFLLVIWYFNPRGFSGMVSAGGDFAAITGNAILDIIK